LARYHKAKLVLFLTAALIVIGIGISSTPVYAAAVTNFFYGTVISEDPSGSGFTTTTDVNLDFSTNPNTNLVGDSFTLAITENGGTITKATFSVDHYTSIMKFGPASTDPYFSSGLHSYDASDHTLSTYVYEGLNGQQAIAFPGIFLLELDNTKTTLTNGLLPVMYLNNGDFTNNATGNSPYWSDNVYNPTANTSEDLYLQITQVNGSAPIIPEPATFILFGSGLVGLAAYRRKFKKA